MMMVTHTAGPWHTNGDGIVRHGGPCRTTGVKLGSPWKEDAFCDGDADAETLANARLIAAAPDLLALAHQYRDDLRYPPTADSITRRLAAIDAVLAKATGDA